MTPRTETVLMSARRRWRITQVIARWGVLDVAAATVCVVLVLSAIFAPLLAPYDPAYPDVLAALSPPSLAHPLGTDDTGRDILSRLLYGGRVTMGGAAIVILITTVAGAGLALAAAWFGGWFDALVARVTDIMFAFPGILVAVLVVAVVGPGFLAPIFALAFAFTPAVVRVIRSVALRERNLPYIAALKVQGFSGGRIVLRHLLPNVAPVIFVQIAVGFAYAMVDLAAISFLGLGLQPPSSDWGLMIAQGKPALLNGSPEQAVSASITMLIAVVSFTLVGERLAQTVEGTRA